MLRILTDRGTKYCGLVEHHAFQLYLAIEDIDHSKTKARHPQTNGICERFHKTMKDEFYSIAFRKKIYNSVEERRLTNEVQTFTHDAYGLFISIIDLTPPQKPVCRDSRQIKMPMFHFF